MQNIELNDGTSTKWPIYLCQYDLYINVIVTENCEHDLPGYNLKQTLKNKRNEEEKMLMKRQRRRSWTQNG